MGSYEVSLLTIMVIIGVAVLMVMGLLVFFFFKRQQKLSLQLRQRVASEVILLEGERSRLSADLHDDLGPHMMAVRNQLHVLMEEGVYQEELVAKTYSYVVAMQQKLREIALHLTPRILEMKGLEAALRDYLSDFEQGALKPELDYGLHSEPLKETAIQVYRIVQELVQNGVKHAGASIMKLRLEESRKRIRLHYYDNGRGFMPEAARVGLGLRHLENRSQLLGGFMECRTEPGKGTFYYFDLPKQIDYDFTKTGSGR